MPGEAMLTALTRAVSESLGRCQLTFIAPQPIDVARARCEHRAYEDSLASLGARVISLPAEDNLPDSVFVEDTAVVLDELAVIARPGAGARRREVDTIRPVLARYRELRDIAAPATFDGGDLLRIGRTLFVGRSTRTNGEGIAQLRAIVEPHGYRVREVEVRGCLHLKTGVTALDGESLLINRNWVEAEAFRGFDLIDVPESEQMAANTLVIGGTVLLPASFPRTREMLEARNYTVRAIEIAELQKAEAGLTCLGIIFDDIVR